MSKRGLGLIVYGVEGIGKTSFALEFPGPILCISVRESGFDDLEDIGMIPEGAENINVEDFSEIISEMKGAKETHQTVIIDSLSGVSQFIKEEVIQHCFEGTVDERMKEFGAFSNGWRIHAPTWAAKLESTCELLRSKGINVILIGHDKNETEKNASGPDFQATMIDMEKWPRGVLTKWAQAVLFMTMDYDTVASKKWKGKTTEAKVTDSLDDDVDRIMYTTKHPGHSAKNRLNLPTYIHMGESAKQAYSNFVKELPEPIQKKLA